MPSKALAVLRALQVAGLLLLAMLALFLRVHGLGLNGLWYDEVFSAEVTRLATVDLIVRTANDVHPPLYYLLLRTWKLTTGSESEAAMRSLSAVFDLFGIAATSWLGWVTFKNRAGALAAGIVHAFSPFAILYAQELRMYSLLLLCSTISIAALIELMEGRSRRALVLYLLSTMAALYSHLFATLLIAAQCLWFFARPSPRNEAFSKRSFLGLQAAMAILYSPWILVIVKQMLWASGHRDRGEWWIPRPPIKALLGVIHVLVGTDWILFFVTLGLIVIAVATAWRRRASDDRMVNLTLGFATLVSLPILTAFAVSWVTTPVFVARFFTEALPALWMLALFGLFALSHRWAQAAVVALCLVATARALPALNYENSFKAPTPYREVVQFLASQPAGVVVTEKSPATEFAWRWYTAGRNVPSFVENRRVVESSDVGKADFEPSSGPLYLLWTHESPPPSVWRSRDAALPLAEEKVFGSFRVARYQKAE